MKLICEWMETDPEQDEEVLQTDEIEYDTKKDAKAALTASGKLAKELGFDVVKDGESFELQQPESEVVVCRYSLED